MSHPNLSLPLATLLREGTSKVHEIVEHSLGAGWLTRAELDKDEYTRYLMLLWHIYDTFERAIEANATHPALAPTYNPSLLARAPCLAADISHFLQVPEDEWKSHPMHKELVANPPDALSKFVDRLNGITQRGEIERLLGHSYVRYLGDLSGGQVIRRRTAKAYNLDDGRGVSVYVFNSISDRTKEASVGEMKKIKEWFREGMNLGAGDDERVKAAILDEASICFDLSGGIFEELRAPTSPPATSSAESPVPVVLGSITPSSSPLSTPATAEKANPFATHIESKEKSYPVASVITVMIAIAIAHFYLVVGGFTGARGYDKWVSVEEWIRTTIGEDAL